VEFSGYFSGIFASHRQSKIAEVVCPVQNAALVHTRINSEVICDVIELPMLKKEINYSILVGH